MMDLKVFNHEFAKQFLVEDVAGTFSRHLKNLGDWIKQGDGKEEGDEDREDLVRYLHAKHVEIVGHTTGAVLKIYRTNAPYEDGPEDCWRFFAGSYEIDPKSVKTRKKDVIKSAKYPGFTHRDYFVPILYVMQTHEKGRLRDIDSGTLIVIQTTSYAKPEVRSYNEYPSGRMIVAGVKQKVSEEDIKRLFRSKQDTNIEDMSVDYSDYWEPYSSVVRIARMFQTDSIPLFFSGRLSDVDSVIKGMIRSGSESGLFGRILSDFFSSGGKLKSEEDYNRLFRRVLNDLGGFEIREVDPETKKSNRIMQITNDIYQDVANNLYDRYEKVRDEIQHTVSQYGRGSKEHISDFRSLGYMDKWVAGIAATELLNPEFDLIGHAVESLENSHQSLNQTNAARWVTREIEESGGKARAYAQHLSDELVPPGLHLRKHKLWDRITEQIRKLIKQRFQDVLQDRKRMERETPEAGEEVGSGSLS